MQKREDFFMVVESTSLVIWSGVRQEKVKVLFNPVEKETEQA